MTDSIHIYIDGASRGNPGPGGLGVVIKEADGALVSEVAEFIGHCTNNQAEYRALLRALEEVERRGLTRRPLRIHSDSQLLVRQLEGRYKVKDPTLQILHGQACTKLSFAKDRVVHIPRELNKEADALANRGIDEARGKRRVGEAAGAPERPSDGVGQDFQHSAGGVVYARDAQGCIRVCLIAKKQRKVWALPKGRVEPGETLQQTARREIQEETGYHAEAGESIGCVNYEFYLKETNTRYQKTVTFFLMPLVSDVAGSRDAEADAVDWFALDKAEERLTHENERAILRKARELLARR